MDGFAPRQFRIFRIQARNGKSHALARNLLQTKSWTWTKKFRIHRRTPPQIAFALIALLNVPAFVRYQLINAQSHAAVLRGWRSWEEESLLGRAIGPWIQGTAAQQRAMQSEMSAKTRNAQASFLRCWAFTSNGPITTWVTSSFIHVRFGHLLTNMIGLYATSGPCAKIPNISALHVFVVTVGASISGIAATLCWQRLCCQHLDSHLSRIFGASAVVSAFIAMSGVAIPKVRPVMSSNLVCWQIAVMQVTVDLAGLINILPKSANSFRPTHLVSTEQINHAGHLGGAVFGVLYYYIVLRQRTMPKGISGRSIIIQEASVRGHEETCVGG